MPELPEVEALRIGLEKNILKQKILKVKVLNAKIVSGNGTKRAKDENKKIHFEKILLNKKILKIERRAKNLLFILETDEIILIHLKMTGQLVFEKKKDKSILVGGHPIQESENKLPHKHTFIIFEMEKGNLYYNDVRQFGYVLYYKNVEEIISKNHFQKLGLEPFGKNFTLKYFKEKLLKKSTPLKTLLLNQEVVVGCGNIYCDEICFASKVLPNRKSNSLSEIEISKIYKNLKIILEKAINSGGSSVANYLLADGSKGNYAHFHKVYGKKGKKCPNKSCGEILQSMKISGRTTVFCPNCQK